jgi:type IV pilus assembly protein PilA
MLARLRKAAEEREGGFTLIELLVVIIIIGILAAIAIPVFLNQRQKGYDAQAKSDLRNLATAEETYLTDHPAGYEAATDASADANLTGAGYKQSSTDAVNVGVDTTKGYCEAGASKSGKVFWFDSEAGGLQSAPSATVPNTGGACSVAAAQPTVPTAP